jgi:hypothetical protein
VHNNPVQMYLFCMTRTHYNFLVTFFLFFYFQSNLLVIDEKYPHIVYVEQETMDDIHRKESLVVGGQTMDLEGL